MSYLMSPSFYSLLNKQYPAKYKYIGEAHSPSSELSIKMSLWQDTATQKMYISDSYKISFKNDIMKYTLLDAGPSPPTELQYRTEINNPLELNYDTMKSGYVYYNNIVWSFRPFFST